MLKKIYILKIYHKIMKIIKIQKNFKIQIFQIKV